MGTRRIFGTATQERTGGAAPRNSNRGQGVASAGVYVASEREGREGGGGGGKVNGRAVTHLGVKSWWSLRYFIMSSRDLFSSIYNR